MTVLVNYHYQYANAHGISQLASTTAGNNVLTIFKGTMPTDLTDWVVADSSSDQLVEFGNFTLSASGHRTIFNQFPNPNIVNATGTGTATWYAFRNVTNASTLLHYMFGDVTDNTGTGSLHLVSTSITSGLPVEIESFAIAANTI